MNAARLPIENVYLRSRHDVEPRKMYDLLAGTAHARENGVSTGPGTLSAAAAPVAVVEARLRVARPRTPAV